MFVESGTLGFGAIPIVRRATGRARPHARNVAEALVSFWTAQEAKAIAGNLRGFRAIRGSGRFGVDACARAKARPPGTAGCDQEEKSGAPELEPPRLLRVRGSRSPSKRSAEAELPGLVTLGRGARPSSSPESRGADPTRDV